MKIISSIYNRRFKDNEKDKREEIWKVLCAQIFQRFINYESLVLDIGAGYCEFINNISSRQKVAVDMNPDVKKYANKDVKVFVCRATEIPKSLNSKIDVIFLSNFLEHLKDKEEVIDVLKKCHVLLKNGGKIIVLQPNINLTKEAYWDFIDHTVALNENSLVEALELSGFKIKHFIKRFLPYTTKSKFIYLVNKFTLKVYLKIPVSIRPLAGQSLAVAIK